MDEVDGMDRDGRTGGVFAQWALWAAGPLSVGQRICRGQEGNRNGHLFLISEIGAIKKCRNRGKKL